VNSLQEQIQAVVESHLKTATRPTDDLYAEVLTAVEKGLLKAVMARVGNISKAALWLGINRATLRKKLRMHGLSEWNC